MRSREVLKEGRQEGIANQDNRGYRWFSCCSPGSPFVSAQFPCRKSDLGLFPWPRYDLHLEFCWVLSSEPWEESQTDTCLHCSKQDSPSIPFNHHVQSLCSLTLMSPKYLQNALPFTLLGAETRPASSAHLGFAHKPFCPSPSVFQWVSSQACGAFSSSALPEDSEKNLFSPLASEKPRLRSLPMEDWCTSLSSKPGQPSKLTNVTLLLLERAKPRYREQNEFLPLGMSQEVRALRL